MTAPMTPDAALIRLRQYGERTSTWSTATYDSGTEKALHEIALTLAAEVSRLRARVTDLEVGLPAMQTALFRALDRVTELEGPRHHPTEGELAEQRHLIDPLDHALEALAPHTEGA